MSLETAVNRYHRQELIEGWDQSKLNDANIAVIGGGTLANFTVLSLAAMGFGNIEVYDNEPAKKSKGAEFLSARKGKGSKAKALEEVVSNMHFGPHIKGWDFCIEYQDNLGSLGEPDIIIDATNNPRSKLLVAEYALDKDIPLISMSASDTSGKLALGDDTRVKREILFEEYCHLDQGAIPSLVLSGLAVEEARRLLMQTSDRDKPLKKTITYSMASPGRFVDNGHYDLFLRISKDKRILLVGAGALGNFAGIGLALLGYKNIVILDRDTVEEHNLNRQVLFYDSVGKPKAESLAGELNRFNPSVNAEYQHRFLDRAFQKYLRENKVDLIIECVDNFKARALANRYAQKYNIPLISGGTDYQSGQVSVYVPGKTGCLNCQLKIDELALKNYQPHSCIYAPQPSVITSNQIIGGLMAGEAVQVLEEDFMGGLVQGILRYQSTDAERVGLMPTAPGCDCHKTQEDRKWWETMKHLYSEKKKA